MALLKLDEKWGPKYAMAIKSWQTHWADLATFFQFTPDIRRLIYTNNNVEAYNRQLRKVVKTLLSAKLACQLVETSAPTNRIGSRRRAGEGCRYLWVNER